MYGIVFLAVKDWIPLQSTKPEWGLVASRASVPDDYVAKQLYEEVAFFRLIKACTEVLGMKAEDVFEGVGLRCSLLLMKEGNDHLLRVHRGSDVEVFLSYFKPLCGHLIGTTPNIELVSQKSNSSRVHFTPGRWPPGSSHFFIGVLKGLAGELCRGKDFVTRSYPNKDDREDHTFSWSPPSTDSCPQDAGPKEGMSVRYFSRLHPFHIMFDRDCSIIQTGPSLQKLIKAETGSHMSKYFTVRVPADTSFSSFRSILYQRQASLFTVSFKRTPDLSVDLLGQMIYLTSRSIMCFVCTPVIGSADEFKALEIQKSDFSLLEAAHLPFSFPGEHSTSSEGEVAAVPEETAEASVPADSADRAGGDAKEKEAHMSLSGDAVNARGEKKGLFKSIFQGSRQERDKLQREDREKLLKEVRDAGQQLQQQPQPQQSAQQQPMPQQQQPVTAAEVQEKRPVKSKEQALRDEELSADSKRRLTKTGSLPDVKISYQDTSGESGATPEVSGGEEGKKENAVPPQSPQRKSKRGFYFLSSSVAGTSSPLSSARDASPSPPPAPVACDDTGVSLRGEKPRQTDPKENSKKRANSGSKIQQQVKSGLPRVAAAQQPQPPQPPDNLPETLIPIPTQSHYHSYFHQNRILHSFIELLLEDSWDSKFVLTKAILQTGLQVQEESVRTHLFEAVSVFYSSMGKFPLLLAALIEDDLSATPKSDEIESQVVFREESAGVRLFVTFLNLEASYYLQHCTGPLMEAVHTLNKPLELNPLRVSEAECAANAAQLLEMCQNFVAHVCRSSDYCPPTVRRAFHVISMEVARRLPAMYLQSIANLLFLRFLSPAIVTPRHGQSRTPAEQRTLTLVAKAVYNLMNNITFGEKEPYMTPMNAFISTYNVNVVQQFMRDLVDEEKLARVIGHKARTSGRTINDMATVQLKSLTSLNNIKKALLTFLPQLWTASFTNPELQKRLQRLLSVSLCDIVTEMVPC